MSRRKYLVLPAIMLSTLFTMAQKRVDLRLDEVSFEQDKQCFNVDLRSPYGEDIRLAGQNYRLFYNASRVQFAEGSERSALKHTAYTELDILHNITNNIGFLSISVDGRELNDDVVILPRTGEWITTCNVCFQTDNSKDFDLTWARMNKTAHFASASVAFSEWINKDFQQILLPNDVVDYSFESRQIADGLLGEIKMYPNPTSDYVSVEITEVNDYQNLIIKDVIGREVVYDEVNSGADATMLYDLTNWPDGLYTIELIGKDGRILFKDNLIKANK